MTAEEFIAELVMCAGIGLGLGLLVRFGVSLAWAPYIWLKYIMRW